MNKICIFLALLLIHSHCSNLYDLILLSQDRGAACLDGTPPGMYLHEGNGPNKDKFLIFFQGGGFCGGKTLNSTIDSCYQRSFTGLGSTKDYQKNLDADQFGYLSTVKEVNPVFYDWTKIIVIYCDGSIHEGYKQAPITYKGKKLYFRGSRNSLEQFHYLEEKYDIYNKDSIVITGVSAGGLATYEWTQYVKQKTIKAKVYGIPDSGLLKTDYYNPFTKTKVLRDETQTILKLISADRNQLPPPVKKCMEVMNDMVNCTDVTNYAKYITAPLLIVQSTYDEWCLDNIVKANCLTPNEPPFSLQKCDSTMKNVLDNYMKLAVESMQKIKADKRDTGAWAPACVQHGFTTFGSFTNEKYEVPSGSGNKLFSVVEKFLQDPSNPPFLLDEGIWPSGNTGCNGLTVHLQSS